MGGNVRLGGPPALVIEASLSSVLRSPGPLPSVVYLFRQDADAHGFCNSMRIPAGSRNIEAVCKRRFDSVARPRGVRLAISTTHRRCAPRERLSALRAVVCGSRILGGARA